MRGSSFLSRVGIATLAGALLVTPALGQFIFNTGGLGWQQVTFSGSTSFAPGLPTQQNSTFTYGAGTWTSAVASTPASFNTHTGYNGLYGAPGFDVNQSHWVGTYPAATGGWSLFYYDFFVGAQPVSIGGIFSSDNTSYLFLDGMNQTGLAPTANTGPTNHGAGSFTVGVNAGDLQDNLLAYHPAANPAAPAQNSYNSTSSFFKGNIGSGSHRLWALVRNDITNPPDGNPLGFRLQFALNDGGGNQNPVPEPFTMALGAAGIGLALRRRMKKSK